MWKWLSDEADKENIKVCISRKVTSTLNINGLVSLVSFN